MVVRPFSLFPCIFLVVESHDGEDLLSDQLIHFFSIVGAVAYITGSLPESESSDVQLSDVAVNLTHDQEGLSIHCRLHDGRSSSSSLSDGSV